MSSLLIVNEPMVNAPSTGTIKDNAAWNSGGYLRLNSASNSIHGEFEYIQNLTANFEVDFDFWTGGGSGADALFFYFGCSTTPISEDQAAGGYIFAYDEYSGESKPYIIQFNGTILANTSGAASFGDSQWHRAKVTFVNNVLTMFLDDVQVLTFTDSTRTLAGNVFGWGGRTGGANNEHRIRNVKVTVTITDPTLTPSLSPLIQVFLSDIVTGNLFEIPFTSLNFIEELNNGKQATINLDYQAVKDVATVYNTTVQDLFTATFREIWISMNGTKIYYGVISEYNRSKDASGSYQMSIASIDYFSLLQKRRTGLTTVNFTSVDPATIPWSLINTSQTSMSPYSDFGITLGATASTPLTVTVSYKNAELRQEIISLSNYKQSGSFDFDIDLTKKFNVYYPFKGSVRTGIVLDDNNILSDTVKIPLLLSLTNSIFVTGQGINNDQAAVNRQASTAVMTAYKLLEDQTSDINISDTTILNSLGDRFLQLNQSPLNQISLKHDGKDPDITTYDVGDTLIVNIVEENVSYAQYRVKKRIIDIDQSSLITVQLDLLLL